MPSPDVLLIDDLRSFRDATVPATVARTSAAGLDAVRAAQADGHRWAQIWLVHDLGGEDTIAPVVDWLCATAAAGDPVQVDTVVVHTSNVVGGDMAVRALSRAGYRVVRVNAPDYLWVADAAAYGRVDDGPDLGPRGRETPVR